MLTVENSKMFKKKYTMICIRGSQSDLKLELRNLNKKHLKIALNHKELNIYIGWFVPKL